MVCICLWHRCGYKSPIWVISKCLSFETFFFWRFLLIHWGSASSFPSRPDFLLEVQPRWESQCRGWNRKSALSTGSAAGPSPSPRLSLHLPCTPVRVGLFPTTGKNICKDLVVADPTVKKVSLTGMGNFSETVTVKTKK